MTVVSFVDYVPLARHDGKPWTKANIFESVMDTGPWDLIETVVLNPIDFDASNPMVRSFTTELATIPQGWYKVQFEDATGDTSDTDPIHDVPSQAETFNPTVSDVGALLRARTKDRHGNEIGTFTADTRPTFDEVLRLIDQAAEDVTMLVDYDIPVETYRQAAGVICLRAAMLVELSYFPEQVANNRSAYPHYKELYDEMLVRLQGAVEREAAEEITGEMPELGGGVAQFGFPVAEPLWPKAM